MKILLLTDSYLPHAGGSRVYYHNLYKRLTTRFPDRVTVLTKKVPGWQQFDRRESSESLQIIRKSRPLASCSYAELPKGLLTLAGALFLWCKEKHDLIHCGDLYPPGAIGLALKQAFRVPYVAYCHGEEITQTDLRRYQPLLRNRIYQGADGVVAASSFAQQHLLRIGVSPERIRRITPGVDCERFQPQPRREELVRRLGLEGKRVLLTVSRLIRRKGHDVILRTVAKLAPQVPDLRYLVVGEGPEQQRLEQLAAELGIADLVVFVGRIADNQLPDFYNLCDVFAMVNRKVGGDIEGFGMVFLEASAAGKAVVGGRSGGAIEAIQEGVTGFLVNPDDPEELAIRLKGLLYDPSLRQRMGSAGLQRAQEEFSWASRTEALREFSREIVHRARGEKWEPARDLTSVPAIKSR